MWWNDFEQKNVQNLQFLLIRDFRVNIRSEFYCSNDVIVGHISLPHNKETVKSMFISRLL